MLFNCEITSANAASEKIKPSELPIEYFIKSAERRSAKISPNGKHLVVIASSKGKDVFAVINTKTNEIKTVIGVRGSGGNIDSVEWLNNERLIYTIYETSKSDKRRGGSGELYAVNLDGKKHDIVFGYRAGKSTKGTRLKKQKSSPASHEVIDYLKDDEEHVLIAYYPWKLYRNTWRVNPYAKTIIKKLNVYNGRLKKIETLPISLATPIVDSQGITRFSIGDNKDNESIISYRESKKSPWKEFSLRDFEGTNVYPFSFTKDDQSVYLTANVGNGTKALYLFNLKDKSIEKIFHDETIDMSFIASDFADKRMIYIATERDLPIYTYIEPDNKKSKLHKKLMKAFKGQDVIITSATKDTKQMVVYVYADNNPGDYFLFDTKTLEAKFLMSRNPWAFAEDFVTTESLNIITRDNQNIHAYLTKPADSNNNLPLVVYPHGGPHGVRDEWGYQGSVQLLASRGYAVLQVNFRGSSGFGKAFRNIGYGKWGTLMQDDLTDATLSVINDGIADPDRVCIYGASYGGYAALMGTVREPDLYQCAIGSVGVYDLPLMFEKGDIANYSKSGLAYLKDAVGDDLEDMKRRSPVYNVDKIKAEILLIHGTKDERVPIEQAHRLKDAFDAINKPYQWLELKNEGHGYADNKNKVNVYSTILDFLDKNIGSKATKN